MLKKAYKRIEARISGNQRLKAKGSNGDKEIMLQLAKQGFKINGLVYQQIDYRTLETVYWQETEFLVEDFETLDHNRYETYLEIVLKEYILKPPDIIWEENIIGITLHDVKKGQIVDTMMLFHSLANSTAFTNKGNLTNIKVPDGI